MGFDCDLQLNLDDFVIYFAEFIEFGCDLYLNLTFRESAAFYVCILLHNTYIHTYIPPLGGVCMYVCMYIVKNNNYSLQLL